MYNRMENQKHQTISQQYQQKLNTLIRDPTPERLQQFVEDKTSLMRQILFNCDNSIFGRAQKDVIIAKKNIVEELGKSYGKFKKGEIKMFRVKIRGLTQSIQTILRDGIIGVYSDITELREKYLQIEDQQSLQFANFLQKVMSYLQPLLRDYFIFKQIQKSDSKHPHNSSLKIILSQKKINTSSSSLTSINSANETHSIKELLSDHFLLEIAKQIELKSIRQLINEELQENQSNEVEETCRICNGTFKLKVLEKHVQYCSKIQAFNSRRQELVEGQLRVIEQLKEDIQDRERKLNAEEVKLYKKIIDQFEVAPTKLQRKSSLHGLKRRNKMVKRLSVEIEEFLKDNKKNGLLSRFSNQAKERQLIEKKIECLENKYLHYKNQNCISSKNRQSSSNAPIESSKSFKTSKAVSIKTKKSLFARKESSSSNKSNDKTENFASEVKKFQSIKAHMDEIVDDTDSQFQEKVKLHKSLSNFVKKDEGHHKDISTQDFDIVKFLGKGAFGKVYMVRRKKTKDIYALKVIKMQQNQDQKQLASIKNQNEILSQIAGEYLVKAPFSFTEGSAHFFVLEYMPGGDLGKVIEDHVYLDFKECQFYLAEIVLAIERIHEMGIIHRDLKPQNLIFDEDGHLKLTDFGLSELRINDKIRRARKLNSTCTEKIQKENENKTNNEDSPLRQPKRKQTLVQTKKKAKIIGTPDYIAPQIISGQSLDNLSIDWWSLGVIAYQMMVGCRPFSANTMDEVISNIEQFNITWPDVGDGDDAISPVANDLVRKLLNYNYRDRLGAKSANQIKNHPFFQGVCWQEIKYTKPPFMPAMDRKQNYEYADEISELRSQIKAAIGSIQPKSSFKLDSFVRYDILVEQTLSSADKKIVKRQVRIKKLKSIASNIGNSSDNNKQQGANSKESLFDMQI